MVNSGRFVVAAVLPAVESVVKKYYLTNSDIFRFSFPVNIIISLSLSLFYDP
jgi:hypothetical protein